MKIIAVFVCKKVYIWASEYNLGPQKWGVRGDPGPRPPAPPRSATDVHFKLMVQRAQQLTNNGIIPTATRYPTLKVHRISFD